MISHGRKYPEICYLLFAPDAHPPRMRTTSGRQSVLVSPAKSVYAEGTKSGEALRAALDFCPAEGVAVILAVSVLRWFSSTPRFFHSRTRLRHVWIAAAAQTDAAGGCRMMTPTVNHDNDNEQNNKKYRVSK